MLQATSNSLYAYKLGFNAIQKPLLSLFARHPRGWYRSSSLVPEPTLSY